MNTINIFAVCAGLCITFLQMIFHDVCCCQTGPVLCSVFIFDGASFFSLPITVMTHCLGLFIFLILSAAQKGQHVSCREKKRKKLSWSNGFILIK